MNRLAHISFRAAVEQAKPVRPTVALRTEIARRTRAVIVPDAILSEEEHQLLRTLLRACDTEVHHYRASVLARRLPACLRLLRVPTALDAVEKLREDPRRSADIVNALLIGVTDFFRDAPVFDHLRAHVLPQILADNPRPRITSIGCADGSELYSLAFLLRERDALANAELLGIDCRPDAITAARRGVFAPERTSLVPEELRASNFVTVKDGVQVVDKVRTRVLWCRGDALTFPIPHASDLILCRNLTIYLDPTVAYRLYQRLAACLKPGGYLCVGKAETPACPDFQYQSPCLYIRRAA